MPYYELWKNGKRVNDIVGPLEVVKFYAGQWGCTFLEVEPPPPPEPTEHTEPRYTAEQLLGQQITDEELARIELGQQVTDLELMILTGGTQNV